MKSKDRIILTERRPIFTEESTADSSRGSSLAAGWNTDRRGWARGAELQVVA